MTHFHHVIPKHAGGTDDPSNLNEVTIQDHAEEHRKLWLANGFDEDRIAWQCLSGQMPPDEAREAARIAAVRRATIGRPKTEQELAVFRNRNPSKLSINRAKHSARLKADNPTQHAGVREKIALAQLGEKRGPYSPELIAKAVAAQRGVKRPSVACLVWVTDGVNQRRVSPQNIPDGWKRGRLSNPTRDQPVPKEGAETL